MEKGIEIYRVEEGEVVFDIDKEKETIWATQEEIARIFSVDRTVISRHIRNIIKEGELEEETICAKNAHMVNGRFYEQKLYNLDAIISVGYRVNSKKATKFRVWATSVLKRYVVDGTAVNERRLKELPEAKLGEIEATLTLVRRLMEKSELEAEEAKGILEVISKYGKTIETIQEFDRREIPAFFEAKTGKIRRNLTIGDVKNLAENLGMGEFRGDGEAELSKFLEKLGTDEEGKTVPEKAARLLYYLCNTMPFLEGNREIGALVFIYFLTVNDFHLSENGETKISDRALTAIVLLISESRKEEKELMIGVVTKLLEN